MIKKILAMVILASVLFSIAIPAFAVEDSTISAEENLMQENVKALFCDEAMPLAASTKFDTLINSIKNKTITDADREKINEELAFLTKLNLFSVGELAEITPANDSVENIGTSKFMYVMDYGPFCETVQFVEISNSVVKLFVTNGTISNTMAFTADGKILVNGKEVEVSFTSEEDVALEELGNSDIMPLNSDTSFQATCPYGQASDYNHYAGSTEKADIALSQANANTLFTVISAVLVSLYPPAAIAATFTAVLWNYLQGAAPTAYGISYKANKYWHKNCTSTTGNYIPAIRKYVTKWNITWFSRPQFGTPSRNVTEYEIKVIY